MITVQDIVTLLEGLAPPALAESWDNVGLLCGDRAREVTNVLCSLDITEQVVAEATERGAQMIVAHHPVIFTSISRITEDDATGRILRAAIRHEIALVCMHTNADCAQGGVNDALAAALFLTNVGNLEAGKRDAGTCWRPAKGNGAAGVRALCQRVSACVRRSLL